LADSRERVALFRNVCVKPNRSEISRGAESAEWSALLGPAAIELARRTGRAVFATTGQEGILVSRAATDTCQTVSAYPVSGPIDICGAGDSCSAGITSAMVAGASHEQAAAFGNLIASITIQQIGVTGTASPAQVRARWRVVAE
jgi:sugar/nucleoside kinase (ribokinase family)